MTHPPTQCDLKLFLDDHGNPLAITKEDINKSISWYEQHWEMISSKLPATTGGVVFTKRWQDVFDHKTLPKWRAGKLRMNLAVAYIYQALRQLYRAVEEK